MRKWLAILSLVLLALGTFGCSQEPPATEGITRGGDEDEASVKERRND